MVDVLKPCPFCGSDAFVLSRENGHWAYCNNDECGAETQGKTTHSDAAAAWNRRSTLSDAVAEREAEPVAWLPTATVKWLEEYEGPACGTQTVAHNRPIKSDGGVPIYLAPPTSELEALRKRVAELEGAEDQALDFIDRASGTALGIAMSGRDHPNPDEVLETLAMDGMELAAALRAVRCVREGGKVE